jgi:hypothetical protein
LDVLIPGGKSMRLLGMLSVAFAMVSVYHAVAYGQQVVGANAEIAKPPAAPVVTVEKGVSQKDLGEVTTRLGTIEAGISKLAERASKTDYTPAYLGLVGSLFGVLVGGLITVFTQGRLLVHQKSLAEKAADHAKQLADARALQDSNLADKRARLEIGNSFAQWQLKQLSELYGPLHALLRQSHVMYRHITAIAYANVVDPGRKSFTISGI